MKQLKENLNIKPLSEYINENIDIDEGLKNFLQKGKNFIQKGLDWVKKTYKYLSIKIAQCGKFFVGIWDDGIMPVITPVLAQQLFMSNYLKNKNITILGAPEDKKFSKINTTDKNVISKRPKYLEEPIKESVEPIDWSIINEEYLDPNFDSNMISEAEGIKFLMHADDTFASLNVDSDELREEIQTSIIAPDGPPLLIWGAPGIGKTQIVSQITKELGKGRMIDLPLANMTEDDFFLPDYVFNEIGVKVGVHSLPHTYFPCYKPTGDPIKDKELDEGAGEGVIFFDEINRAKPQVLNICLKLINQRLLGEYKIGSKWTIISAANRYEDEEGTNIDLNFSKALGNRFVQVNFAPSFKTWRQWAEKQGYISADILNWLELNQQLHFYNNTPSDSYDPERQSLYPTPRAWDMACQRLAILNKTGQVEGFDVFEQWKKNPRRIERTIASAVGSQAAKGFMQYLVLKSQVDIDKLKLVWTKPDKAPLPLQEGKRYRMDSGYIFITTIASFMDHEPTPKELNCLADYLIRLNNEILMARMITLIMQLYPDLRWKINEDNPNETEMSYTEPFFRLANHYEAFNNLNFNEFFGKAASM